MNEPPNHRNRPPRHPGLTGLRLGYGVVFALLLGLFVGRYVIGAAPPDWWLDLTFALAALAVLALIVMFLLGCFVGPWWRAQQGPRDPVLAPRDQLVGIRTMIWVPALITGVLAAVMLLIIPGIGWIAGEPITGREFRPIIGTGAVALPLALAFTAWGGWYQRKVVSRFKQRTAEAQLCFACGYDMRGSASATCPECGYENELLR